MKRYADVPNRLLQLTGASNPRATRDAGDKGRVPVPSPTPVFALPQILTQPFKVFRPGPMRQIGGNHISGLFQRSKAFLNMRAHKADNFGDAGGVHVRRDIDQSNRFKRIARKHACGNYGCKSSKRSTDYMRPRPSNRDAFTNLYKVSSDSSERVITVWSPVAFTMPAKI